MKKKLSLMILCLTVVSLLVCAFVACNEKGPVDNLNDKGTWCVTSPDGTIKANLVLDAYGALTYSVTKDGKTVVEKSTLGIDIEEDDLSVTTLHKESQRTVKGEYDNISGKVSHVAYNANETTLTFKAWEFYIDVIMRAYDDGYAFRYNVRKIDGTSGVMTIKSENTTFALPTDGTMWAQKYVTNKAGLECFSYEVSYQMRSISALNSSEYIAMPLIYNVPNTEYYSLVTESELVGSGLYGSFLKAQNDDGNGVMQTVHTPAGIAVDDNKVEYPFESPWRVGIVGDMKTVQESELVEKVYDDTEYWKPDNYDELSDEEQEIYNYDWVETGTCAWNWLVYNGNRDQSDFNLHYEYLSLAQQMGWKYVLLDGGWDSNSSKWESNLRSFVNSARSKGIKVLVWCNALTTFGNGNLAILQSKLDKWAECGVAGIKIDFFDGQNATDPTHQGEDINTIKWYESIYQETAKRKMVVNCHGCNKPTGERRLYPNVINREAVYGNEFKQVSSSVTVNELFVRNVVGPTDFTPVLNPLSNNLTKAHQMALALLFESGAPSMADFAKAYTEDNDIYSFYKTIPSLRKQTLFLGGMLDEYYAGAVETEDYWFVGIVNSTIDDKITVDFSFLGDGEYVAEVFTDVDARGKSVQKQTINVTNNTSKTFAVYANGGVAIRIKK